MAHLWVQLPLRDANDGEYSVLPTTTRVSSLDVVLPAGGGVVDHEIITVNNGDRSSSGLGAFGDDIGYEAGNSESLLDWSV